MSRQRRCSLQANSDTGITIESVAETGSTNADLVQRVSCGEQFGEGYWLRADVQTGGHGRRGRNWLSPHGNLHCSTVVRLGPNDPPAQTLSFVAALAVYDCLDRSLLPDTPIVLKWPNDVMVYGEKIAGILAQRVDDCAVVGIGVNVCHAPELEGRRTTSILSLNGKHGGSTRLVHEILAEHFSAWLGRWREQGEKALMRVWLERAHPPGTQLRITEGDDAPLAGNFAGIESDGALRLKLADGSIQTVRTGDVALAPVEASGAVERG